MQTVDMIGMKDVVGYRGLAAYLGVGEGISIMMVVECAAMVRFLIQTLCRYVLKYYKLKEAIRLSPSEIYTDFYSRTYQINVAHEWGIRRNLLMAPG
jgi:hypothetical protein